jgi:hypothetical protein
MIDLLTAKQPMTELQIRKRAERMIKRPLKKGDEAVLNRLKWANGKGRSMSQEEQDLESAFESVAYGAETAAAQARQANALLEQLLAYEKAKLTVSTIYPKSLYVAVNGRPETPVYETVTVVDGEGNETQEQQIVRYLPELEPTISATAKDEEGNVIPNPDYLDAETKIQEANDLIDSIDAMDANDQTLPLYWINARANV